MCMYMFVRLFGRNAYSRRKRLVLFYSYTMMCIYSQMKDFFNQNYNIELLLNMFLKKLNFL